MPNKFVPYWRSPVRKVAHVLVVKDWGDCTLDYKLPKHVAHKLCDQGKLYWDHENNCFAESK